MAEQRKPHKTEAERQIEYESAHLQMAAVSFDALGGTEAFAIARGTHTGMAVALTSCK